MTLLGSHGPEAFFWENCDCPFCTDYRQKETAKRTRLQARYISDPAFAKLADDIHSHRMLAGPACFQCLEIADAKLPLDSPTPPGVSVPQG